MLHRLAKYFGLTEASPLAIACRILWRMFAMTPAILFSQWSIALSDARIIVAILQAADKSRHATDDAHHQISDSQVDEQPPPR